MPARRPTKPWTSMKNVWPLLKKPDEYIDPGFQNFGVRVSPKGKCVWWARYSEGTGKARKEASTTFGLVQYEGAVADGVHILDLFQAHAAAREWIAEQKDPAYAAERRAAREAAKAKPLTLEDGFEEYKRLRRTKRGDPLAETTKDSYTKTFKTHLNKAKDWPLLSTPTGDWVRLLAEVHEKSPSRAMEAMCIVSGIYTHYETMELPGLTRNPIRNVRRMRLLRAPAPRRTHASAVDLPQLVAGIWKVRNKLSRDVVLCYLFGGLRKMAAMRLRRSIVDLNTGIINVPKGERGWKGWYGEYPLNAQLLGILKERDAVMEAGDDWFFPARHGSGEHLKDVRGALYTACTELPTTLLPHDLRRTFGTICDMLFPGDVALSGALLSHKWALPESPETSITLRYQQRTLDSLRHASDSIANAILEIASILPMTDETAAALRRKGIDPKKLELLDMSDDDEDEDEGAEA